jgi:hypothetical protein
VAELADTVAISSPETELLRRQIRHRWPVSGQSNTTGGFPNTSPRLSGQHRGPILVYGLLFKKKNPEDLFVFLVISEQGKRLILCFQSVSISAIYGIDSNVFYR